MLKIFRNIAFSALLLSASILFIKTTQARDSHQTQVVTLNVERNFINRDFKVVEIYNNPEESISDFTVRLANPSQYSGCAHMIDGDATTEIQGGIAKSNITETEIQLAHHPRYTNHDCVIKQNISFIDIPMNRDELMQGGITTLAFSSNYGDLGSYEILVSEEKIDIIIPYTPSKPGENQKITTKQAPMNKDYTLRFWFFPKNSVMLSAPHARLGTDVREHLNKFAQKRGLVPMEKVFEGYEVPRNSNHYALFTDPNGLVTNQLGNRKTTILGTIDITRKAFDINGPKEQVSPIEVRASYPIAMEQYQ